MTKHNFIKGALILLAAGMINRLLGFVPRVMLPRIIGAEGVGLYQLSYPFLTVLLTIITGGIPLAVAKWIAEAESIGDKAQVRRIFRISLLTVTVLALLMTALLILLAPWITTHLIPDSRVYNSFLMMAPMLLLIALSSVYRGYFQGKQDMLPSAISQIVETLLRIAGSLFFSLLFLPYGIEWAAAGAMLGAVIGELGGLLVLLWKYNRLKQVTKAPVKQTITLPPTSTETRKTVFLRLMKLSVPVTASRMIGSLSYLLESIFIARSLAAAGIITAVATAQYGALQGMIIPLILLPTALTYSLAVSLVPSLAEAQAKGELGTIHKRMHQSMRLALVAGAPFVVFMWLFAEPICRLLYAHSEIAPMLKLMAPIGVFIYLQAPLQAALQALDKAGIALLNTFIGAAIKLVLIVQLASTPSLGIYGAVIAIGVNIALVTILHAISVYRFLGYKLSFVDVSKVISAMIIMGAASRWLMNHALELSEWLQLLGACAGGTTIYLLLMIWLKIIDKDNFSKIPYIGRFISPSS